MPELAHLKLAVFGQSGAGKTVFFASYYGSQHSQIFETTSGYHLEAQSKTQGNTLLGRYNRLSAGKFPDATDVLTKYAFDIKIGQLPSPGMTISWLDYPGGWWERVPTTSVEKNERDSAVKELLSSHAILLFLDGEKLRDNQSLYLQRILHDYSIMIKDIKKRLSGGRDFVESIPHTVILAVTKADLLPISTNAKAVSDAILAEAENEVNLIARELGSAAKPAPFPTHVMLLSSVHSPDKASVDVSRSVGLDLIAPICLAAILDETARRAGKKGWAGYLGSFLSSIASFVHLVDKLDDFLPKRYQVLTIILKALPLEKLARAGADELERVHSEAVQRFDAVTATAAAMSLILARAKGPRSYYRGPG